MKKKIKKASKKKQKGGKKMFGLGKDKKPNVPEAPKEPETKTESTGPISETDKPNEEIKPEETGKIPEPEKTQEEEEMTLATKKEPEKKKEVLKVDGKEVRSVYTFKTYTVYDFVGGGRKKVMNKDVKKDEEK